MSALIPTQIPDRVTIYAMAHPDKPALIRYIGATVLPLKRRMSLHFIGARYGNSGVNKWIMEFYKSNKLPVIWPIETVEGEQNWVQREKYWIWLFKPMGLLNKHPGGNGRTKSAPTREAIEKTRISNTGLKRSQEICRKLSEIQKKRFLDPEVRERNIRMLRSISDKLSDASPSRKPVICLDTGERFNSAHKAELIKGFGRYSLGVAIKRGRPFRGQVWKYL